MAYCRVNESGHYIWADDTGINFDDTFVSNEQIDIFLVKLYQYHFDEFKERILHGRDLIFKQNLKQIESDDEI